MVGEGGMRKRDIGSGGEGGRISFQEQLSHKKYRLSLRWGRAGGTIV